MEFSKFIRIKKVNNSLSFVFLIIFIMISLLGCDKADREITVKSYVRSLKKGEYNDKVLPAFSPHDIPALLTYRDDTTKITKYPVNPISSYCCNNTTLGIYVLWTIESIRLAEVNGITDPLRKFPSLNPLITSRDGENLELKDKFLIQKDIADAYASWWSDSSSTLEYKLKVNPLESTNYKWN